MQLTQAARVSCGYNIISDRDKRREVGGDLFKSFEIE